MTFNFISNIYDNTIKKGGSLPIYDCPKDKAPMFNCSYYETIIRNKEKNPPYFDGFIILDFDSGISHTEVQELLDGYKYFMYASKSCTKQKDKFRVLLPTDCEDRLNEEDFQLLFDRNLPKRIVETVDPTCKQLSRFYFVPNKGEVFYTIDYMKKTTHNLNYHNKLFHFDTSWLDLIKAAETAILAPKTQKSYTYTSKSENTLKTQGKCLNYDVVKYYLETSFRRITGNGNSMTSLFKAIRTCVKYHDVLALEKVLQKARSEMWSERSLQKMLQNVLKYI